VTPGAPGTAGRDYRAPEQPHPWTPVAADVGQRATCTCGRERGQHGGRNGLYGSVRASQRVGVPVPRDAPEATRRDAEREVAS
jgi:hypothetical protein